MPASGCCSNAEQRRRHWHHLASGRRWYPERAACGQRGLDAGGTAAPPGWLWPLSYSGFIFGSLSSVGAVVALASTLTGGVTWALIRLAIPALIAGVTLHEVDGSLNAVGLTGLGAGQPGIGAA